MIHVLVVGPRSLAGLAARRSSVEVLHAETAEEAVEKLARNRRVDAVLLLLAEGNTAAARAIREDVVPPPPLFAGAADPAIPGVRPLASLDPAEMLDLLESALEDGGEQAPPQDPVVS
jgi:hypothetical protein